MDLALEKETLKLSVVSLWVFVLFVSIFVIVNVLLSAQRLNTLQLELTAVQLLRQQLEESIRTNEELRDDLEREIDRAKLREGAVQSH